MLLSLQGDNLKQSHADMITLGNQFIQDKLLSTKPKGTFEIPVIVTQFNQHNSDIRKLVYKIEK